MDMHDVALAEDVYDDLSDDDKRECRSGWELSIRCQVARLCNDLIFIGGLPPTD